MDEGGGAFYGPKIDLKIKDALGREWQMTTIQFDWNEPERFDITYVGRRQHAEAALHGAPRAPRLPGALLRRADRALRRGIPAVAGARCRRWPSPSRPAFAGYGEEVVKALKARGVRAELDKGDERMNAKIRNAQNQKVPFMLILGEKEQAGRRRVAAHPQRRAEEPDPPGGVPGHDRGRGEAEDAGLTAGWMRR